jgi:hypothetical protein
MAGYNNSITDINSKVGIGTGQTEPSSKLDVDGVIRSRGGSYAADLDTRTDVGLIIPENNFIYTADGSSYLRKLIGKTGDVITIGEAGTSLIDGISLLPGTTGGHVQIYNNSSVVAKFVNNNLSLGMTDPQQKLHIVDTDGANIILNSNTGAENNGIWMTEGGIATPYANGAYVHYDSTNNAFKINTGTTSLTTRFTIERDTGNVGIGTLLPSVPLAVEGVASMGSNSRLSMGILDINSNGTPTQILIQTTIPWNSGSADFTVNIKGFVYGTDESCNLSIHWHYYNSVPYNANITSSGSWAPIANLHSSSTGFVQIHLLSPGYWPKIYVESMYSSAYNDLYASGWSWSDAAGDGTAYALDYNKDFGNNFVMTDPGNVGIGTSSPTSLLEVSQNLSAVSTIDYPYTISSRDDGNLINQQGGEGVGIKFRIAGNQTSTPGNSLIGASIAAIREVASDSDSSTGLGFFVTQNDEVLDEALRIDHDKNANFLSNVDIADSLDVINSIDLGTQVWKTYTNTAAKLNIEVAGGNAINIFNTQEDAAFLNFIDSQSDGTQYANLNFNSSGTNALIINNMGYDTTISNAGVWTFPNNVNATTFLGNLQGGHTSGTISSGVTATTQPNATDNTTIATTAYVVNKIAELPAGLQFLGTWNADTNTPTLATGGGERSEGTATTVTADKLIDSAATFTTAPAVVVGDRVRVVTPNGPEFALVTAVDSATQLTLASDIVTAIGETYILEVAPFLPEGSYYIVSDDGATDLNGITDWKVGDWAVASSTNVWQKIDNSSVLDGQGTGQTIPLWSGSGNSNTLTNSNITQTSSTNVKIASSVHITDSTQYASGQASIEVVKLQRINTGGDIKASTEGHVSMWATDSNNDTEWARMSWVNDNAQDGGLETEGALCFWTSQEGTLNRAMYIDHNQNVGIGTDDPGNTLHVYKNATIGTITSPTVANAGFRVQDSGANMYVDGNSFVIDTSGYLTTTGSNDFDIGTNSTSRIKILGGGNVGIGTVTPDSELDIRSDSSTAPVVLKLGNAVASGDNNVIISQLSTFIDNSNTAANELSRIQVQNSSGSHDDGIMSFWTRDGVNNEDCAQRMTISGGGLVGIGIDVPLNNLSIESTNGTSPLIKIRNKTNGGGAGIEFNDNGTAATTQNGTLKYYHSDGASQGGGASFWLEAQPDTVLVVGNGTNTGRVIVGGNSATEVGYGFYDDINTGMFKPANHQLGFATNGTNRLTISTYINAAVPIKTIIGTAAIPALQVGDDDSGLYDSGANEISVSLGGVQSATFHAGGRFQAVSSIQAGDDTNDAGASRVGAMRYRTGTEYVEVDGVELVTNGDFATDSDWTKGTGVTIASGVGTWTNTANNVGLTQLITFTANAYYRCKVTVSNYSSGSFRFRYPGISNPRITANGTYSLIIQADQATNDTLYLQGETNGDANVNFSIDNVSVMEVTEEDASYADMCMQTGASTYEWVNIVRNTY